MTTSPPPAPRGRGRLIVGITALQAIFAGCAANTPPPSGPAPVEPAVEVVSLATPPAAPEPPPAPLPPRVGPEGWRAFVYEGLILACSNGREHKDGADCAAPMAAVSLYRPFGGEVRLRLQPATPGERGAAPACPQGRPAALSGAPSPLPLRRPMTSMPLDNNTYTRLVAEVTGQQRPELTALLRIDLDDDGAQEVLFASDSHPKDGATTGSAMSAVALRAKGPTGAPETLFFFQRSAPLAQGAVAGADEGADQDGVKGALLGFTDLDGDGVLDVVVEDAHPGGVERSVWRLQKGALERLGGQACGAKTGPNSSK